MHLNADTAARFSEIALSHVTREYPNAIQHVLADDSDAQTPRMLHPIFYGSFDWHSCVHGYWTLARCLRRFPDHPHAGAARALFEESFTPDKAAGEIAYFERPLARAFERPYGWGWLLALAAEISRHEGPQAQRWTSALTPLAEAIALRLAAYLPLCPYPVRAGVHSNTAFALTLALEYADARGDAALADLIIAKLRAWHGQDRDCQAWEPSQDDFLSPCLMIAVAMQRALAPDEFAAWFAAYLPRLAQRQPAALFAPAALTDRSDGKIAHLDGLNLSRAWCWRSLAHDLDAATADIAREAADVHLRASLPHLRGEYAGEHWLASFALLALEA